MKIMGKCNATPGQKQWNGKAMTTELIGTSIEASHTAAQAHVCSVKVGITSFLKDWHYDRSHHPAHQQMVGPDTRK